MIISYSVHKSVIMLLYGFGFLKHLNRHKTGKQCHWCILYSGCWQNPICWFHLYTWKVHKNTNHDGLNNLGRGSPKKHFCKLILKSVQWFLTRWFLKFSIWIYRENSPCPLDGHHVQICLTPPPPPPPPKKNKKKTKQNYLNLIDIAMKFHQDIPYGYLLMVCTTTRSVKNLIKGK